MSSADSTSATNTASVSQLNALGDQLKSLKNTVATLEKSFKEASKEVAKTIKDATKAKKAKPTKKSLAASLGVDIRAIPTTNTPEHRKIIETMALEAFWRAQAQNLPPGVTLLN